MASNTKKQSLISRLFRGLREEDIKGESELPYESNYGSGFPVPHLLNREQNEETHSAEDHEQLIQPFPMERLSSYAILDEMADDPTIDSALKMHVANALSAKTDTSEIVFIQSTKDVDDHIVRDLRNVVAPFLNENCESIAYNAGKYGTDFVRPYCEWGKGIVHIRHDYYTQPAFVRKYERAGDLCGFLSKYQKGIDKKGVIELIEPWKFVEFKVPKWSSSSSLMYEPLRINPFQFDISDDDFKNEEAVESQDYGTSIIKPAYEPYVDLQEAILSLNSARKNASKRDRFVTIQTGNKNPSIAAKYYNSLMAQLKRIKNLSAKKAAKRGHISTIDTHVLPVSSDGTGNVNFHTEQSEVNISAIEDVNFHINRMCGALGTDKSLLGFTDDMSGGLGEGGWWTQSMIAAIKANLIRRAIKNGAEALCRLHVLFKYNKIYSETDKPWRIEFNSLNNVLEREESTARDSRIQFATSVVTLMQMLDPEMNHFKINETSNWLFTDVLRVSEETFKGIVSAIENNDKDKVENILDSLNPDIPKQNISELKALIYQCMSELMETTTYD